MKQVFVIDPGMMEAGGHHAALLETLCVTDKEGVELTVFSHAQLDNVLADKASFVGIEIHRHFKTNFYQHYDDNLTLKVQGLQQYIRYLAAEYLNVFSFIAEQHPQQEAVCFYPCLNWEHASALSLALTYIKNKQSLVHKVCCMFTPPERDELSSFYYRLAFRALSKSSNIELYTTDWETREYYFSLNIQVKGFHPCYLLHWQKSVSERLDHKNTHHFLLYMGDAKENKGFTQLPELVESYITKYDGDVKLTIQFTLAWDYPELAATVSQLVLLNNKYEQLNLYEHFWSTPELIAAFQEFTGFVCTYNPLTYKNKSSGLTWLAAYFNLHVVVSENCWIVRELERLGSSYSISNSLFIEPENVKSNTRNSNYYQTLFMNLITWLKE
jgi:hypothetical protein